MLIGIHGFFLKSPLKRQDEGQHRCLSAFAAMTTLATVGDLSRAFSASVRKAPYEVACSSSGPESVQNSELSFLVPDSKMRFQNQWGQLKKETTRANLKQPTEH